MADAVTAAPSSAQDFTTPDRSSIHPLTHNHRHFEEKKDELSETGTKGVALKDSSTTLSPPLVVAATVTPSDTLAARKENAAAVEAAAQLNDSCEDNKQVRFDENNECETSSPSSSVGGDSPSKRGLVSRRGGRCASPGRTLMSSSASKETHEAATAVLEFKTFRSPDRKQRDESDTVPSLCSAGSIDRNEESTKLATEIHTNECNRNTNDENLSSKGLLSLHNGLLPKPSSNSSDVASNHRSTSPRMELTKRAGDNAAATVTSSTKKNIVTFSPVPPPSAADRVRMLLNFLQYQYLHFQLF